jgi:hypothetical protein
MHIHLENLFGKAYSGPDKDISQYRPAEFFLPIQGSNRLLDKIGMITKMADLSKEITVNGEGAKKGRWQQWRTRFQ